MQLDCNRHFIAGVRADSHCRKCARRNEKEKVVDSKIQMTPSLGVASPQLRRSDPLGTNDAKPVEENIPPSRAASAGRSAALSDATQLQIQKRGKKCVGCGAGSIGVVFCFEVCPPCGELINEFNSKLPWYPGPCIGETFKKTQAALRQLLRKR